MSEIEEKIIAALREVYDPEIPVNIYDLGLIYKIEVTPAEGGFDALIEMTLTSANCPLADMIPAMAQDKVLQIPDVKKVMISLTFDPPWNKDMMSDEAKLALDMF